MQMEKVRYPTPKKTPLKTKRNKKGKAPNKKRRFIMRKNNTDIKEK